MCEVNYTISLWARAHHTPDYDRRLILLRAQIQSERGTKPGMFEHQLSNLVENSQ